MSQLQGIIFRLEKLALYIDEMRNSGHVKEFPNLFATYISEKIMDEIPNLEIILKDKIEEQYLL